MMSFFIRFNLKGIRRRSLILKKISQFFKNNLLRLVVILFFLYSSLVYIFPKQMSEFIFHPLSIFISYVIQGFHQPMEHIRNQYEQIKTYKTLMKDNLQLTGKIQSLEAQNQLLNLTLSDLQYLHNLLKKIDMVPDKHYPARVLGAVRHFPQANLFVQVQENLKHDNMIAVHEMGYVGRVVEKITQHRLRILMVTDHKSRVPVRHQKTGMQAILEGQGTPLMTIKYVENFTGEHHSQWRDGDIFVTSGIDETCQPNIPVAYLKIEADGSLYAQPIVDLYRLRFVVLRPNLDDLS